MTRPLRVFLCHSSADKPAVRELYEKLVEQGIDAWLDKEKLYPGQDWSMEIEKAIEETDVIIVCLSNNSITKEGYVQREIRIALDYADYKPEGTLFVIPVRLEECTPPKRLARWQYADYFEGQREQEFKRLLVSLRRRADSLGIHLEKPELSVDEVMNFLNQSNIQQRNGAYDNLAFSDEVIEVIEDSNTVTSRISQPKGPIYENKITLSNGMEFMRVPAGKFLMGEASEQHSVDIPYAYWMARFPVTNEQYNVYVKAKGINHPIADWQKKKDHPVVSVNWNTIMEYCQWLNNLLKAELSAGLVLRLPTEAEWEKAARGTDGREYPWGSEFDKNKCNSSESGKRGTTSVGLYSPQGDSPYGCADMSGNVWEWTHSEYKAYPYNATDGREDEQKSMRRILRGGSFVNESDNVRCACRGWSNPVNSFRRHGFRVVVSPVLPS